MGVLQAAGMRGVLRLNKKSTFSGRLLISARPDVGGMGVQWGRAWKDTRSGRTEACTEGAKSVKRFKKAEKGRERKVGRSDD